MRRRIAVLTFALVLASSTAFAQWTGTYRVTVTNLTAGQLFTPIIAATHGDDAYI